MEYFDTNMYRRDQRTFELEIIRNYYLNDWARLTGLSWDERPDELKELHRSFEYLRTHFPIDGDQADQFRAEMERVRNALKAMYENLNMKKG